MMLNDFPYLNLEFLFREALEKSKQLAKDEFARLEKQMVESKMEHEEQLNQNTAIHSDLVAQYSQLESEM